jgi:hypothetical protein
MPARKIEDEMFDMEVLSPHPAHGQPQLCWQGKIRSLPLRDGTEMSGDFGVQILRFRRA